MTSTNNPEPSPRIECDDLLCDPTDEPEYHAHLEELAKDCKCADKPCDGCMAGAPCDAYTYGDGTEGWSLFGGEGEWEDDDD